MAGDYKVQLRKNLISSLTNVLSQTGATNGATDESTLNISPTIYNSIPYDTVGDGFSGLNRVSDSIRNKYSAEELASVTQEEIDALSIDPFAKSPLHFSVADPLNPGLGSLVSSDETIINPGITGLRNTGLQKAGSILSDLRTKRNELIGNKDQFINNRLDPLRENINKQKTELDERLQKTGITGEFGKQTQESFQASARQRLESGQQLALDEFTQLANNLDQVEGGMLRLMENIDFSKFTQDLQARGLSQDLKNQLTRLEQGRIGIDQQQKQAEKAEIGNWLSLFSQLLS